MLMRQNFDPIWSKLLWFFVRDNQKWCLRTPSIQLSRHVCYPIIPVRALSNMAYRSGYQVRFTMT